MQITLTDNTVTLVAETVDEQLILDWMDDAGGLLFEFIEESGGKAGTLEAF